MAKNTAECGKRDERALVKDLTALGYRARRQPGSGNVDPTLPHDVVWEDSPIGRVLIECKWRATCGWRTLLTWMEGAPILTLSCDGRRDQDSDRYVFIKFDTFMAMVGDAAARSEHIDDLPQVEPDKPQFVEAERFGLMHQPDPSLREMSDAMVESQRLQRLQSAHKDPPKRKPEPNKLKGRGFGK
ncbi:MAG: hypothetical protein ACR2RF_32130 [Geminicoccaceae bacterium]